MSSPFPSYSPELPVQEPQPVQPVQLVQPPQPVQPPQQPQPIQQETKGGMFFVGFVLFWALGGIAALIMSLACFGLSGNIMEKIVGLFIAFFLGPLYFVFYGFNKGYCRNLGTNVVRTVNNTIGGR